MTKIRRLSDAEIGENTLRKIQKILPKAIEKNRALTELPIMCFGTVPETLKWALTNFLVFLSVNLSQSM